MYAPRSRPTLPRRKLKPVPKEKTIDTVYVALQGNPLPKLKKCSLFLKAPEGWMMYYKILFSSFLCLFLKKHERSLKAPQQGYHAVLTCIVGPGVCGPAALILAAAAIVDCCCCPGEGPAWVCCSCCCCSWVDACGESPNPGTLAPFGGGTAAETTGRPMIGIPEAVVVPLCRTPAAGTEVLASLVVFTTGRPIKGMPAAAAAAAAALPCVVKSSVVVRGGARRRAGVSCDLANRAG